MSNILPSDTQKEMLRFYRARFILTGSLVFLVGAFLSMLALLPGTLIIKLDHAALGELSGATPPSEAGSGVESERAEILRANALVEQLSTVSSPPHVLEALRAALDARPLGTYVEDIQYTAGALGAGGTLIISGNAANRTSINNYRAALADDPRFSSVSLPVGALVGAEGGRYSITLTGQF